MVFEVDILKLLDSLPSYNGQSDINEFIVKVEIVSNIVEWLKLRKFLGLKLSGDAFRLWQASDFSTYESFKNAFFIRFSYTSESRNLKFTKVTLALGQSLAAYCEKVRTATKLKFGDDVPDKVLIREIIEGLPDNYAKLLLERSPQTYDGACQLLTNAEEVQLALKFRKTTLGDASYNETANNENRSPINAIGRNNQGNKRWNNSYHNGQKENRRGTSYGAKDRQPERYEYTRDGRPICAKCKLAGHIQRNCRMGKSKNLNARGRD